MCTKLLPSGIIFFGKDSLYRAAFPDMYYTMHAQEDGGTVGATRGTDTSRTT